ncbi:hypothetical protein [Pusillimonas sp. ANT_WB101]|uniref:hypothetical protein n=1 Tax=Pusillimonas sp. ANT_WB101 TaxID=2597356 RepID=UPI00165DD9C2|nr:hypothetical protein [Pusillimonas sp. ANT_WB101]
MHDHLIGDSSFATQQIAPCRYLGSGDFVLLSFRCLECERNFIKSLDDLEDMMIEVRLATTTLRQRHVLIALCLPAVPASRPA